MADYCRLRQICLVAADLPRAIADMQAIFGVKLAYQDPQVRRYGLQNALFPFGLAFVEIVSPMQPDTAAGRFLERYWRRRRLHGDLQLQRSATARP